jgi:hypothetical protein
MFRALRLVLLLLAAAVSLLATASTSEAKKRQTGCTMIYLPVCALNRDGSRSTYANACLAKNAGARILHPGQCVGSPFFCFLMYSPVCARSPLGKRRTYPNLCEAENANAVLLHNGACR